MRKNDSGVIIFPQKTFKFVKLFMRNLERIEDVRTLHVSAEELAKWLYKEHCRAFMNMSESDIVDMWERMEHSPCPQPGDDFTCWVKMAAGLAFRLNIKLTNKTTWWVD